MVAILEVFCQAGDGARASLMLHCIDVLHPPTRAVQPSNVALHTQVYFMLCSSSLHTWWMGGWRLSLGGGAVYDPADTNGIFRVGT